MRNNIKRIYKILKPTYSVLFLLRAINIVFVLWWFIYFEARFTLPEDGKS